MSKPHKKLVAWRKSMDLVERIYALSKRFPRDEVYGLTSQVRRVAVSVPSNIASSTTVKVAVPLVAPLGIVMVVFESE